MRGTARDDRATKWKIVIGVGVALVLAALITSCLVAVTPSTTQAPGDVSTEAPLEREDCDADDRTKGEWWECPDLLRTSKKPGAARKTPAPRTTRR